MNTSLLSPSQSPRLAQFIEKDELPFSINDLNRWPNCTLRLKPLKPNKGLLILFETPIEDTINLLPTPKFYRHICEDERDKVVLLPCDSSNIITRQDGSTTWKWELINRELRGIKIESVDHLEKVIKHLNPAYSEFNFNVLRDVLDSVSDTMTMEFFQNLLPRIIELALSLPEIVTQPVPLLSQNKSKTLVLSQKQVACLMANAFLCLFPKRNSNLYRNYPDINFWR